MILPHLRRLLPAREAEITLLEALPSPYPKSKIDADRYLRRISFRLNQEGFASTSAVHEGPPAETILREAKARSSTMIALATHGRSGLERLLLGSVAEKVLQSSPVPVFLAKSFVPFPPAGTGEPRSVRNILFPLDGSAEALSALDPILSLARREDARVQLLEVGDPTPFPAHWDRPDGSAKKADEILREACIPTTFEYRRGQAAEEILRFASLHDVDLIVMATHGRSGPPLWLKGSVTAHVLQHATVPMLVVRRHAAPAEPEGDTQKPADAAENSLPAIPPA
jgi:nucleotide-binding universal stress UspA family protein